MKRRFAVRTFVVVVATVALGAPVGTGSAASAARIHVEMPVVRLFDVAKVTGTVTPAHPGERVRITLFHAHEVMRRARPTMRPDGSFTVGFRIREPGWYRVEAAFSDADHTEVLDSSRARRTPLPALSRGAAGVFVRLLEHRLVYLGYRLDGIDQRFSVPTGDAVVAFHKVQGMTRVPSVSVATWRALAHPIRPHARLRTSGFHIEINQSKQVLLTIRDGEVERISHVSTGKPSTPTYDGTFKIDRKVPGTYHGLYYPSYFDGNRAIHGWVEVPTYPASHGCVRFPFWNARWIFGQARLNTVVYIFH
jgi:hypothetical protein